MTDIFSPALLEEPHLSREDIIDAFLTHLPPLLYLREIGAERLIEYAPKIHCQDHWPEHAKEEGLGEVFERQQSIKDQLREGATFSFENNDAGERGYWMSSPDMTISTGIPLREFPESTEEQLQRALVDIVFNEQFGELTSDVTSAHQLDLPASARFRLFTLECYVQAALPRSRMSPLDLTFLYWMAFRSRNSCT